MIITKIDRNETFKNIAGEVINTLAKKQADYGNSFTDIYEKYPISIYIRLQDKLSRLESLIVNGKAEVKDESFEDTLKDIIGYCILALSHGKGDNLDNRAIKENFK